MFPAALAERVIQAFTAGPGSLVLDPFAGSGSTLLAAAALGRAAVGLEINPEYVDLARRRISAAHVVGPPPVLHCESAEHVTRRLAPGTVDLCFTSPPYWDVLARRRTADGKETRDYAPGGEDLSRLGDYGEFVDALGRIFAGVGAVLRPGGYCVVNVMDLRRKDRFYPLHSDLARAVELESRDTGMFLDDLIIWDRRSEYNNLRPLGYPSVFRINKVHEFLVVFRRPPTR